MTEPKSLVGSGNRGSYGKTKYGTWRIGKWEGSLSYCCEHWGIRMSTVLALRRPAERTGRKGMSIEEALNHELEKYYYEGAPKVTRLS